MTRSSEPEIVRHEDGSIMIEHYRARARRQRSAWFTACLRALWQAGRAPHRPQPSEMDQAGVS